MSFFNMFGQQKPDPYQSMFDKKSNPFDNISFDGSNSGATNTDTTSNTDAAEPSYSGRDNQGFLTQMRDILMNEGPAHKAYNDNLNEMPTPTGPGKMNRTIAAIMGGLSGATQGGAAGAKVASDFVQAPYRNAMENWQVRNAALGKDVQMEDDQNSKRAQFATLVRQTTKDDRDYKTAMMKFDLDAKTKDEESAYKRWQMSRGDKQDSSLDAYRQWQMQSGDTKNANEATYQQGMLANSAGNLDVARGNLGVNRFRANNQAELGQAHVGIDQQKTDIDQQRADTYGQYIQNGGNKAASYVNPSQQKDATKLATQKAIAENPGWRNFVNDKGDLAFDVISRYPGKYDPRNSHSGAQDFLDTIKAYEDQILGRSRAGLKGAAAPVLDY